MWLKLALWFLRNRKSEKFTDRRRTTRDQKSSVEVLARVSLKQTNETFFFSVFRVFQEVGKYDYCVGLIFKSNIITTIVSLIPFTYNLKKNIEEYHGFLYKNRI